MNIQKEHKLWHYTLHFALATFTLLFLVLSDSLFFKKNTYGSNLVFGDASIETTGSRVVEKNLTFETTKITRKGNFFAEDFFHIGEMSGLEMKFSDFTVMRTASNTNLSIVPDTSPSIRLDTGKIWVSTKEHSTVYLPQAKVETIAGTVLLRKNSDGITFVTAWDKPSKITFFGEQNKEILWELLLPAEHQIKFAPNLYFSKEEFSQFSLSKLQKEFEIQKVPESEFITENIVKDLRWKAEIIRAIEARKSSQFNVELKASIFEFSPNIKEQERTQKKREEVMTIWDTLSQKNFSLLTAKMKNMTEKDKQRFMRYAGFFPEKEKSFPIFLQSFPPDMEKTWKTYWHLEAFLQSDGGINPQPILLSLFADVENFSLQKLETNEFLTLALFKNHSEKITVPIIRWLNKIDTHLIAVEVSKESKITRKLDIVQSIFSITDDLIAQKKFVIARQMLDNMDMNTILDDEVAPLFATIAQNLSNQKNYKRGEVEYAEILGDEERKDFSKYLTIKDRLLEKSTLHSAPVIEYSSELTIEILRNAEIFADTAEQNSSKKNIFILQSAKNSGGVRFSAVFDAKKSKISSLILKQDGEKDITQMQDFSFSLEEITEITPEQVRLLSSVSPIEKIDDTPRKKKIIIPSEIIDFVSRISQNDFITEDIMVEVGNLEVTSITTSKIKKAIPHFIAIEEEKKEAKRKKYKKKSSYYTTQKAVVSKYDKYFISFDYNVEDKKAENITATYLYPGDSSKEVHNFSLTGKKSLVETVKELDAKIQFLKELYKVNQQIKSQFGLSGFRTDDAEILVISPSYADVSNLIHTRTGLKISGKYNPKTQSFLSFSLLNISKTPSTVDVATSLKSMSVQFLANADALNKKVREFNEQNNIQ